MKIFADAGTLTGSIGVIMNFMDYQGLQDKVGIKSRVVKSGEFKDIGSGSRAMTLAEKELLGEVITDVYEQFLDATVDARMERVQKHLNPTNPEAVTRAEVVAHVKQYADGRIFSGRQAANTAMIDGIKNLDETALARMGTASGFPVSVRALANISIGHVRHHINVMNERYLA